MYPPMEIKLPPANFLRQIISMETPVRQLGNNGGQDHQLFRNTDLVDPSDIIFLCNEIINIITFQKKVNYS